MDAPVPDPQARRGQSAGEEWANTLSHGLAAVLVLAAFPLLLVGPWQAGEMTAFVARGVFLLTMLLVYATSAAYHAVPAGPAKRRLHRLDHIAIYLFIAGTYTPFTVGVLRGFSGTLLLVIIWSLAALGVWVKLRGAMNRRYLSTLLYVLMGWVILIVAVPVWQRMDPWGLAWLVAGGLCYTLGAAVFLLDRVRYVHFVWHLWVMAGSFCQGVAVWGYSSAPGGGVG